MTDLVLERLQQLLPRRGVSRSQHYRDQMHGLWTMPIVLGPRCSVLPKHENDALLAAQVAGFSRDQMRELVRQLHEKRGQLTPRIDAATEPRAA